MARKYLSGGNMTYMKALIAAGLSTVLVACSNGTINQPEKKTKTEEPAQPVTSNLPNYKIGTVFTYPPFASSNENGKSEGFDIDVINAIAKVQGFEVTYMPVKWDNWQEDLESGKVDVWAAGIAIKDNRKEFTTYSNSYLDYHTVAMVLDTNENKSININNINKLVLSAEKGTVDHKLAMKLQNDPSKVVEITSSFNGFEQLIQKKVGAVIGNDLVLKHHAIDYPEIKTKLINLDSLTPEADKKQLGFMVKKNRNDLADKLNQGLTKIKSDGTYNKIVLKWFGKS